MVTRKLIIKVLFTDLSIKNGGYAFLIRLDLMFSVSLWKKVQLERSNRCRIVIGLIKKLSSLTRDCNLPIITGNETIINLTQYELSQEESDLLKEGLYFSIQPEKIQKSKIFTTFEKIHCLFLNNLKSEETKSQIKKHLLDLTNSYFYNYKPSPHILHQHRVLWNLRKNKDIVITRPDKGNGVAILDWKLYNNASEEIISDTSKFNKAKWRPNFETWSSTTTLFK